MQAFKVKTLSGERTLTGDQGSYMEAQKIAEQSAKELGTSVYLWYADRAPVRVDGR